MEGPTGAELYQLHTSGGGSYTYPQLMELYGLTYNQVRDRVRSYGGRKAPAPFKGLAQSIMPKYDNPLKCEGDAVVLFDPEFPFHHADFINRVLELAQGWQITNLIIGGDVLHFDCLSAWGAAWQAVKPAVDSLSEETEREWRAEIAKLPAELQGPLLEQLNKVTGNNCQDDEILQAQKVMKALEELFTEIQYVLGNHDDRFLRKLNSPLMPQKLLDFIGLHDKCWKIGPYFFSELVSEGQKFHVEHPASAADGTAIRLADKYECHALCGHAHSRSFRWSTSGNYYAIMAGHCCDETRFPYSSQRHTNRPAHGLGAVIVRGGFPFLLHPGIPWDLYKRM